ncbi:hypothetical protein ALI22I_17630 [Saccharothrix sp. ALI-22-I]|nr:hypothetical protein ALI22I_17630 [Saccharothrix sp. ALI-22-I]
MLRKQTYDELTEVLSEADLRGVRECAERMLADLGAERQVRERTVMVAYGGGKDSAYMLAFVRAVQLLIAREYGDTFTMRVVTMRHAGMPYAVMANVDRSYQALRLYDDPDCELLLVDGNEVNPFHVDRPQSPEVVERNRTDILMTGHRTFADGRPTFCNACNFSVAAAFGLAAAYDGGVDMIVTGDSPQEQRSYFLWICRLARRLGVRLPERGESGSVSFGSVLSVIDDIAAAYFADIHGTGAKTEIAERRVEARVPRRLSFFTIYTDTAYASGDHWELLTGYLRFVFDDTAFNFTESDCANPALMAHLRALRCERLYGQRYADGLAEYVEFAINLMRGKQIPEYLIQVMRDRYAGPDAPERMRQAMNAYALDTFGITEEQLVAMVYSPFAERGLGLADYLRVEHPALAAQQERIVAVLNGQRDPDVEESLRAISGLRTDQLRTLYTSTLRPRSGELTGGAMVDLILEGDPHKRTVLTRQDPNGPAVPELISGR